VWMRPGSPVSPAPAAVSQVVIASTTCGRGGEVDAWSR
jgi:hypothetical protein